MAKKAAKLVRKAPARSSNSSGILKAVHDTARSLHDAGFIDKRRMQHYEVLCVEPIAPYSKTQLKALRERANVSQAVFARVLNTTPSTIQKWETGAKRPSGPSLKLLSIIDRKGLEAVL